MSRVTTTTRISFGLACTTVSVLMVAFSIGFFPNQRLAEFENRKTLCETVAIECCFAAQRQDKELMRALLQAIMPRHASLLSVGLRKVDGSLFVHCGPHETEWAKNANKQDLASHLKVPIMDRKSKWGDVEFCFSPLEGSGYWDWLGSTSTRTAIFITAATFLLHSFYLRRTLRYLNPSDVIPDRVRATLDTLAEGVLLIDRKQRIVLANAAFAKHTGRSADELQGMDPRRIEFTPVGKQEAGECMPWVKTINDGTAQSGVMLALNDTAENRRSFVVSTTPIIGQDGTQRGALATFDDVTIVEQKNLQLEDMLQSLQVSRDEIHRQNEELVVLATRDPLTGCLNRRAFFGEFDQVWHHASTNNGPIGCIMVDIDHFKSVNDNHGHATGDQVLQVVGAILRDSVGPGEMACRYGGEEFCVVLPNLDSIATGERAEAIRQVIAKTPVAGLRLTASLGVSASDQKAPEAREMLNQADKALYSSKHNGRNRVTRYDELPADFDIKREAKPTARDKVEDNIPFAAVSALMSALAYRDVYTAQHSRRVADLCLAVANSWLSPRDCRVLEAAALLHDIGKLGVPDAILLKPGPLNPEEWDIMRAHDRMGIDILTAAFADHGLTEIVRTHQSRFDGQHADPDLPSGDQIPVGGRLIAIADAYDAMVSDRVYREGLCREEACIELRRCAGAQFDPELVERFIMATETSAQESLSSAAPRQAALLGGQIESLARALDTRDLVQLAAAARRVAATASHDRLSSVVDVAAELQRYANQDDADFVKVVELTSELVDLCRSTQSNSLRNLRLSQSETQVSR